MIKKTLFKTYADWGVSYKGDLAQGSPILSCWVLAQSWHFTDSMSSWKLCVSQTAAEHGVALLLDLPLEQKHLEIWWFITGDLKEERMTQ